MEFFCTFVAMLTPFYNSLGNLQYHGRKVDKEGQVIPEKDEEISPMRSSLDSKAARVSV